MHFLGKCGLLAKERRWLTGWPWERYLCTLWIHKQSWRRELPLFSGWEKMFCQWWAGGQQYKFLLKSEYLKKVSALCICRLTARICMDVWRGCVVTSARTKGKGREDVWPWHHWIVFLELEFLSSPQLWCLFRIQWPPAWSLILP